MPTYKEVPYNNPNSGLPGNSPSSQGLSGFDSQFNPDYTVPNDVLSVLTGTRDQYFMQREQQQFDEYMYQRYNSPQALKRQFEEAGLNTNLLGSTSFGTAQSSASAPAVNSPAQSVAAVGDAVNKVAGAASLATDVPLKASQVAVNMSLPELNKNLAEKYGNEALFTDIQYQSANQLLEWSRQDRECNAMTLRLGYFQACQNYKNSIEQWNNLVKEGKVLDEESEFKHWEAKIKEETFNTLIEHHYLPDADFLDKIYTDYVLNGNTQGFNKYVNGFTTLEDARNRSTSRFGGFGGTIEVGPFKIGAGAIEYILQSGRDLYDVLSQLKFGKTGDDSFWSGLKNFFVGNGESNTDSGISSKEEKAYESMDDIIRAVSAAHPDWKIDKTKVYQILKDDGFSNVQIGKYLKYRQYD